MRMLGQCGAMLGQCGAMLGQCGAMLGQCGAMPVPWISGRATRNEC